MKLDRSLLFAWVALVSVLGLSSPASAEHHEEAEATPDVSARPPGLTPWDQDRVTELAGELVVTVKELRQTERRQPRPGELDPQERSRMEYMQTLQVLERSTKQLHKKLEGGAGRDDTINTARKLRTLVRDAETLGKAYPNSQEIVVAAGKAYQVLDELGPYYFGDTGPSPDPMIQRGREKAVEAVQ